VPGPTTQYAPAAPPPPRVIPYTMSGAQNAPAPNPPLITLIAGAGCYSPVVSIGQVTILCAIAPGGVTISTWMIPGVAFGAK